MSILTYLKQLLDAREAGRKRENAKSARETADKLFPAEKWIKAEDGIYLSPRRAVGKKSNYRDELRDAQILRDLGNTVYLVAENSRQTGKKYDALVNGQKMEFKNIHGASIRTFKVHFLDSRSQAPNVFINLEKSSLEKHQVISALYGVRNDVERYSKKNSFSGGLVILKIRGQKNLIYLDVDSLKFKKL